MLNTFIVLAGFFGATSWRYCNQCKDYRFCDMKEDGLHYCQICIGSDTREFFEWLEEEKRVKK